MCGASIGGQVAIPSQETAASEKSTLIYINIVSMYQILFTSLDECNGEK